MLNYVQLSPSFLSQSWRTRWLPGIETVRRSRPGSEGQNWRTQCRTTQPRWWWTPPGDFVFRPTVQGILKNEDFCLKRKYSNCKDVIIKKTCKNCEFGTSSQGVSTNFWTDRNWPHKSTDLVSVHLVDRRDCKLHVLVRKHSFPVVEGCPNGRNWKQIAQTDPS